VFVIVLILASLVLGAGFWAVFTASLVTIATQVVIDGVWRRRHISALDLHNWRRTTLPSLQLSDSRPRDCLLL
jgi:hypothetical protein